MYLIYFAIIQIFLKIFLNWLAVTPGNIEKNTTHFCGILAESAESEPNHEEIPLIANLRKIL